MIDQILKSIMKASQKESSTSTLNLTGRLPIAKLRMSVGGIDNTLREMQ
jgi:hypothetical protein